MGVSSTKSRPRTVVELLEAAARRFADRDALLFKPGFRYRRWSFARVYEDAGKVARMLRAEGLRKGDRAVLWGPNCPQWVIAYFGCLRAGVVVVPLDLRSSPDLVDRVVANSEPSIAFVSRISADSRPGPCAQQVYLEELEGSYSDLSPLEDQGASPDDLVEIMYTSGTTGEPKGVMLTHRNLVSNVESSSKFIPGSKDIRLVSLLPLSHMFEQTGSLLMAVNCGASITFPASRQPAALMRTIRERKATTLLVVPQALELIMNRIESEAARQGKAKFLAGAMRAARFMPRVARRALFGRVHRQFGGRLDFVVSGGAPLDSALGDKWHSLGVRVIQGYGATEASPAISSHTLRRPIFGSVGRPLPGVDVQVAGDGELLVKGANISPGYWRAPALTASAFVDGWYKTGDIGHFDRNGYLHIRGRKKDMIALPSGQKVYPDDIESVIRKHPSAPEAVVVGLPSGTDLRVHAVFLKKNMPIAGEVVRWVNERLADHQQVHGFTIWQEDDFPRTHTLKVRKNVVLEVLRGNASVPSRNGHQRQVGQRDVRQIAAGIAGVPVDSVNVQTALGRDLNLDSLRRVELLSAIEDAFGVYVDESQVGPATTVGQLEEIVSRSQATTTAQRFPDWGLNWWCRPLRGSIQRLLVFPLLRLTSSLRVSGRENLKGLRGPVILAANHNHHFDNGLILKAMPHRVRRRLAIASAADLWRNRLWALLNPVVGNGFPFSREGAIRPSLENVGRLLDRGWSILIYPEGKLTIGGPIQPFKSGTGLLAVEGGVPVVPIRLVVKGMGAPWKFPVLRRASFEVRFGEPLQFAAGTSYSSATEQIERAVNAL
ncbi:MAG: AMP-binding protein [Chloroflexi bacterium]|nr:AMP-binding protein [Chloroflexota bacterium]